MTVRTGKDIVMAAWQTFATRDARKIRAVFSDDAEWTAPQDNATARALQTSSGFRNPDDIAHFLAHDFGRLFEKDVQLDFRNVCAEGDNVLVELRLQATLSNGRRYDNDYCFAFGLKDGLVHRMREYMDTAKADRMIFGEA